MNESIEQSNQLHHEALAMVEAFKKAGGKVITAPIVKRKIAKGTINKPDREKSITKGETNLNKFNRVMKTHIKLSSVEVCELTGMATPEMFRCARKSENEGLITRQTGKGMGGVTVFNLAENSLVGAVN